MPQCRGSEFVDRESVRFDRRQKAERSLPDPKSPRSSSQLVATLAATILNDVAASAGGHTCPETVLLCSPADVWLVRAFHVISDSVSEGRCIHAVTTGLKRAVEVGTHPHPSQ